MYGFLKFGAATHMKALLREGLIYCNTVRYFQRLEQDQLRGDSFEGLCHFFRLSTHDLYVADTLIADPGGTISITRRADLRKNIFCVYSVGTNLGFIDHLNFRFGDMCVFINNPPEFNRRIEIALRALKPRGQINVEGQLVKYVDRKNYDGPVGPFVKFDEFAYQSEFRYVMSPGIGRPFSFRIGSIEDIATAFEPKMVNRVFGFDHVRGRAAAGAIVGV